MRTYFNIDNGLVLIFTLLLFLLTLNNNATFSIIGFASIFGLLSLSLMLYLMFILKKNFIVYWGKNDLYFFIAFSILLSINIIALFRFPDAVGIKNVIQLFLILCFALFVRANGWSQAVIKTLGKTASLYVIVVFGYWILDGMNNNYEAYMGNPNAFAAFLLPLSFFICSNITFVNTKKKKAFYVFIFILLAILVVMSGSRSALLAGFIGYISYMLIGSIVKKKFLYKLFFIFVASSILLFTFIYPRLHEYPLVFKLLNNISLYFGKNIYSGRESIWRGIIDSVDNLWIGIGAGANTFELIGSTLGAHNLYIQLIMQVGLIGVIALFGVLYSIWMRGRIKYFSIENEKTRKVIKLSSAFLIAIMIHQMFEVTLTQNNFGIGLVQWLVIIIGTSADLNNH